MSHKKLLFAKFLGEEILLEQGRLLFSLLNSFSSSGYRVELFNNLSDKHLDKYAQMAIDLDNILITDSIPEHTDACIYLFDKEDKALRKHRWNRLIQVRYDIFSGYWFKKPIIMPFPVHPVHAASLLNGRLDALRSNSKIVRVFFSGDTKDYTRNRVRYPKEKLPRQVIINTLVEQADNNVVLINDHTDLDKIFKSTPINKCVIVDTGKIWVDDRNWLDTLSRTDFFLSPPGIVMPMCHNAIEAMAVGSIPITNYPEWFDPALEHMKNCIVFDDQQDLIMKINQAIAMDDNRISRLRKNVLDYYDSYLRPGRFIEKIESREDSRLTVLMITEGNMAKYPSKLNKHSILMKGA